MKFFVPSKLDGETDETAYERIKAAAVNYMPTWRIKTDRIFRLHFVHNRSEPYVAEVGEPDPERSGEIVTAIFSTDYNDMCLVATTHSRRGGTMITMADSKGMQPTLFDAECIKPGMTT